LPSHGKYWRPSKLGFVNDAAFCPSSNSVILVAPEVDHFSWTLVGALQLTVLGPVKLMMRTPEVCAVVVVVVALGTDVLGAGAVVLVVIDDAGAVDVGAAEVGGALVVVVSVFLALLLQAASRRSVRIRARRITGRAIVGPS